MTLLRAFSNPILGGAVRILCIIRGKSEKTKHEYEWRKGVARTMMEETFEHSFPNEAWIYSDSGIRSNRRPLLVQKFKPGLDTREMVATHQQTSPTADSRRG